ncbi:GntR family transcriptional regulator [Actinokineospora iranica]|uniref:DNA-binding transcriptional regulator, GntR family n=1 Tax=Actinokineospora iranica TaxID=1271860 RepID=A0A1G6W0F1_9PSEU|nr:UTRA domain-containing protein [Actinokineospora iranica]SDD58525.1 DNA-binding transcriptional regulator, GntR family [Actinokineospora iranica]
MASTGRWTSVSMPYASGQRGDVWAAEAAEHGGSGTQKLLSVEEVPASAVVSDMLDLNPGEPVVVRRRLMLFNEHPVELTDSYYPATIARGTKLAEPRKIRGGAVALLADLGHPPRRVREDVSARLATPHEQAALELDALACVLLLARVLLTDNDRPVEASMMTMVAEGRRLRYELTP